jgi:hypothetical protein
MKGTAAVYIFGSRTAPQFSRAKAARAAIEEKLTAAQDTGGLREFNAQDQRRRRAVQALGKRFMGYSEGRARFRAVRRVGR